MKLKLIACKSMFRELSYLASISDNIIDCTFMRQGYHEAPSTLHEKLQAEIDAVESGKDPHTNQFGSCGTVESPQQMEDFDAIALGYGLCSNGILGLCSRNHPLVIPRAHDCMTMLLGSKERYMEYFEKLPGCFWYSGSWIENSPMPCEAYQKQQRAYLEAKGYDEDILEYCIEEMTAWTKNYHYAAYVKMPFYDQESWQEFTKKAAEFYHWQYKKIDGDMGLMKRLVDGDWNADDFLIVPPGYRVIATNDQNIIGCEKISDC